VIVLFGGTAVECCTSGRYKGNDVNLFGTDDSKIAGVLRALDLRGGTDH